MPNWQYQNVNSALTGEYYSLTGAGETVVTVSIELDNKRVTYFRKEMAIWDLAAFIGGFAVALHFFAKIFYGFVSMGSSDKLDQAYMLSQYQTRTRKVK